MKIHRYGIHKGEEPAIVGNERSGMIVFAGCHLRCSFCYTPEAAFEAQGERQDLAKVFQQLVDAGAQNLNLISPSHVWNEIRGPLIQFRERHPNFPIVLKVSGFEGARLAREFATVANVVVMDFKVSSSEAASSVQLPPKYGEVAQRFLEQVQRRLPFRQEGERVVQGVVVRTLWLPMASEEAIGIHDRLQASQFDGIWNLMGYFVDSTHHRLRVAPTEWFQDLAQKDVTRKFDVWKNGKPFAFRSGWEQAS